MYTAVVTNRGSAAAPFVVPPAGREIIDVGLPGGFDRWARAWRRTERNGPADGTVRVADAPRAAVDSITIRVSAAEATACRQGRSMTLIATR